MGMQVRKAEGSVADVPRNRAPVEVFFAVRPNLVQAPVMVPRNQAKVAAVSESIDQREHMRVWRELAEDVEFSCSRC